MRLKLFLLNIVLAVLWAFMWGTIDIFTVLFGFFLSFLLLAVVGRVIPQEGVSYTRKVWNLVSFTLYFLRILIKANMLVAWEICTPGFGMTPAILKYDVTGLNAAQITSLANAITLTPGTLTVDVCDNNHTLYIHCMYAKDRAAAIAELDELKMNLMKEVFA